MAADTAPLAAGGAVPALPVPVPSDATTPAPIVTGTSLKLLDVLILALVAYSLVLAGAHAEQHVLGIPDYVLAIGDILAPVMAMLLSQLRPFGSVKVPA